MITLRDQKSVEKYLNDISKFEVLSPEEEQLLFKRLETGDEEALKKIVTHNLRFVVSVAKQYQFAGLDFNDLISEGNIGLLKAAERFDPTKGFKFISYAVWWIRQSILQALNLKARKIRLPAHQRAALQQIQQYQSQMWQEFQRAPTNAEIAEKMDLEESKIAQVLQAAQHCSSLDAPAATEEESDAKQYIEDKEIAPPDFELATSESLKIEVASLLSRLKKRERTILSLQFGIGNYRAYSAEEISDRLGITRERVRQIVRKAMAKIKKHIQKDDLTFSLD